MRLTKRDGGGNAVMACDNCEIKRRESCCSLYLCRNALIEQLAAYEDAEDQGMLVRLPCKVGDTLYEIDLPEYGVIVCNVLCFTYGRSNITGKLTWCVAVNVIGGHGLGSCYTFDRDDFGKTVFLTREEADAALKGETEDV